MNLCIPFASMFMLGLGFGDKQIGTLASITFLSQTVFAFLSGPITDKAGRRLALAVTDFCSWCLPCLIWMASSDYRLFVVAAMLNGFRMIAESAWGCLLVEDAKKDQIIHIYTWVHICGNLTALFAPIASILISRLTIVPAMRILYVNAFIVMTTKILLLYKFTRESAIGVALASEAKGQSLFSMLRGYGGVVRKIMRSRAAVFATFIFTLVSIVGLINSTFWQVIVNKKIGVPDEMVPVFIMARSIATLLFFFIIASRVDRTRLKRPLLLGFMSYFAGQALLALIPAGGAALWRFSLLSVSMLFDIAGASLLPMLASSLAQLSADETNRARVLALLQTAVMFLSMPFGYIGGLLSEMNRSLPFAMNLVLVVAGVTATAIHFRKTSKTGGAGAAA
jgi:MFS family permease